MGILHSGNFCVDKNVSNFNKSSLPNHCTILCPGTEIITAIAAGGLIKPLFSGAFDPGFDRFSTQTGFSVLVGVGFTVI